MREESTGDLLTDKVTRTDGQTDNSKIYTVFHPETRASQILLVFFSVLLNDLLQQMNTTMH